MATPAEMIDTLEVESYGCIKKQTFKLSPLHALIGPNDSGKSTILRALRTVAQFAGSTFQFGADPTTPIAPFDPMIDDATRCRIRISYPDGIGFEIEQASVGLIERVQRNKESSVEGTRAGWNARGVLVSNNPTTAEAGVLRRRLAPARLLRLDPDAMRQPSALIPSKGGVTFQDERGTGLAGIYDVLQNRNLLTPINVQARKLFPSLVQIELENLSHSKKELAIMTADHYRVPAAAMSEGLLYYLAFAAIQHLAPTSMLLVEEPENGLHPSRIADVVKVLRKISETTQVILATHSPLVINELKGHEVSLITRTRENGTQAKLLKDTFNYDERAKIYANGELWLSYANGEDEKGLLEKPEPAA